MKDSSLGQKHRPNQDHHLFPFKTFMQKSISSILKILQLFYKTLFTLEDSMHFEIKDSVFWVGKIDWELRKFHGEEYSAQRAVLITHI